MCDSKFRLAYSEVKIMQLSAMICRRTLLAIIVSAVSEPNFPSWNEVLLPCMHSFGNSQGRITTVRIYSAFIGIRLEAGSYWGTQNQYVQRTT